MAIENKFDRSYATHFMKLDGRIRNYRMVRGRLYVWLGDRWMFESWFKNLPECVKALIKPIE